MRKKPSARAATLDIAKSFMEYLDSLRHVDKLPEFAVGGIPVSFEPDGAVFSPYYDVYVSLGGREFIFYKQTGYGKFQRYKDVSGGN